MTASSTPGSSNAPRPDRGTHRAWLLAIALFGAITVAFTWPLPAQLSTHLLGTGTDPDLLMWALGWNAHAFLHQPFSIFDANIFYPSRYALAYSENMIGSSLLVAPVLWATDDLVLAMNVVQLSSVLISAIGAWLLARRLGLGLPAAILAGLVFGFSPARFFRLPQAHLTTIQWMPFCLAFLHTYFSATGRPRDLRLAVFFFTAQALTSGHGAAFLAVAVIGLLAYRLALGEPFTPVRWARDLHVPGALLLLPSVLLVLPYRAARGEVPALTRALDDFGSSLSSYFSSPTHVHEWMLAHAPAWMTATRPDAHLFPGVLPLVLAVAALFAFRPAPPVTSSATGAARDRWRNHPVPFYALLAGVSAWMTIGPPFGLWRWTYWLPIFSFLRVPSRFVLLEVLALAVLAAFGFERLTRVLPSSRQRIAAVAAGLLLLVEFAPMPMTTMPYEVRPPAPDRWLATRPGPFVVAEVPVPDSLSEVTQALRNTRYMLHSTAHWQKIVHGYSGAEPAHYRDLHWKLTRFPDDESLRALADLGVTYVVMHPDLYPPSELADAEARIEKYRDWLRVEYLSAEGRVYSLHRPAGAAP